MTAILVAGAVWGDEGKGSIVDALARRLKSNMVVRYNGGHQAAHNVVTPEGLHHTFNQFGSGTFVPGVLTYLSEYVLVSPPDILKEGHHLQHVHGITDAFHRMFVNKDCLVVTPFHRAANRLIEMSRGHGRHGSTGLGIGETRSQHLIHGDAVLKVHDLADPTLTREKLHFHRQMALESLKYHHVPVTKEACLELMVLHQAEAIPWCMERYKDFHDEVQVVDFLPPCDNPIFEGAQGALLDEDLGYIPPNVSWTNTTFENAEAILKDAHWSEDIHKLAVFRSYFTRHGAGPFPSESQDVNFFEPHNVTGEYAGAFRQGHFDTHLAAMSLGILKEVNSLAINHLDMFIDRPVRLYRGGSVTSVSQDMFVETISDILGAMVSIYGSGPTHLHKTFAPGYFRG